MLFALTPTVRCVLPEFIFIAIVITLLRVLIAVLLYYDIHYIVGTLHLHQILLHAADAQGYLQFDLERISDWFAKWLVTLNVAKCKVTSFSQKTVNSNVSYHFDTNIVDYTKEYKYLGVFLKHNLS